MATRARECAVATPLFSQIHRRGMIELGVMALLIVAVTILTNEPPANAPAYTGAGAAPLFLVATLRQVEDHIPLVEVDRAIVRHL